MDKITSLTQILSLMTQVRTQRQGFITNFFPDQRKHDIWIARGELYYSEACGCHFVIRLSKEVNQLFFITTTVNNLAEGLKHLLLMRKELIVTDIVGDEHTVSIMKQIFEQLGFESYEELYRMSRLGKLTYNEEKDPNVNFATILDTKELYYLLHQYFNPLSEQLPCEEELTKFINTQRVLVYKDKNKIIGFIIFELNGMTLYLRYWFVRSEYRNKKIGSKLFNEFMRIGSTTRRQLLWVIANNENAIKRYRHYGYTAENLFDYVLIKH